MLSPIIKSVCLGFFPDSVHENGWNSVPTFDKGISRKMSSGGNLLTAILVVRAYIKGEYIMGALVWCHSRVSLLQATS